MVPKVVPVSVVMFALVALRFETVAEPTVILVMFKLLIVRLETERLEILADVAER